jgi:hypothetical protein
MAADLASVLHGPACASYVDEGQAGGISLIIALYGADQPPSQVER